MSDTRTITMSVQVLPLTEQNTYAIVDAAIAAIKATGIRHMVSPMETVLEGTWEECMAAAKAAHDACFAEGTRHAVTFIKISDSVDGSTIDDKLASYR